MNIFQKSLLVSLLFNTILFSNENLKKVKFQLSWFDQFQFAGYYTAKENGYYEQMGLDVEIIPYKMNMNIPSLVSKGQVDFAVGRENIILERANNYENLRLIYATFQSSPLMLLTKNDSNIKTIKDFIGKKIMSTLEDSSEVSIKAMITSENVNLNKLKLIKHTHNINDLINNKVDIISAYSSKTPFDLDKKGIKYRIFNPKDYGFNIYSDFLYTNNELVVEDIQTIEKFKQASIKGWKYAYSDIDKASELILKKYNNQNLTKEQLLFEAEQLKELSFQNKIEFGDIDKNKIQRMFDLYKLMGFVKNELNTDDFILENSKQIYLTLDEKRYLKNKKILRVCSLSNGLPYGKFEDGESKGISSEFISLVSNKLNINVKTIPFDWKNTISRLESNQCDIIPLIIKTTNRNKVMAFTSGYINQTLVIATRKEQLFIDQIEKVGNKKIAVLKNTAFVDILKEEYPKINLFYVNSASEGLKKVDNSEVFAYVDTLVSTSYTMRKKSFTNLKIAGKMEKEIPLSMSTRINEPLLTSILDKALNNISKKEKDDILNNWISIHFSEEVDYDIIFKIIFIFFVLLMILFIFMYKQNKLKKEIENLNKTLEQRVKKEVENNRIKDIALFKQSKLASMGEMIRNIAHQWRQPLNRINLSLCVIQTVYEEGNDKELINNKILYAQKNIKYMSETIDDFMNFFKADKKKNSFSFYIAIKESLKLLESRTNGINITINVSETVEVYSYKNEYMQVLLIILNNAIDNFRITNVKNKIIEIDSIEKYNCVELYIKDNSGGIEKKNLENIFEPYFTTKFKKEGTGLGLYMAKILIEESMNGTLSVQSESGNTTFIIRLKK